MKRERVKSVAAGSERGARLVRFFIRAHALFASLPLARLLARSSERPSHLEPLFCCLLEGLNPLTDLLVTGVATIL